MDRHNLRQIVEFRAVTPGYFQTMGMHLLAGRDVADSDRAGSDRVIVIGATAAKKWWPGRSPIGETIRLGGEKPWRIVGVVSDAQMHSLVETDGIVLYLVRWRSFRRLYGGDQRLVPNHFAVRTAANLNLAACSATGGGKRRSGDSNCAPHYDASGDRLDGPGASILLFCCGRLFRIRGRCLQ